MPTGTKAHDQSVIPFSRGKNVVAPAGGWMVLVEAINRIATPLASAMLHQQASSQMANAASPTSAEIICPPITLRGWENGAAGAENSKTQEAPKGTMKHSTSSSSMDKSRITAMAIMPPTAATIGTYHFGYGIPEYTLAPLIFSM